MYEIRNSSGHPPDQISMSCNAFLREIFPVTALAQLMASSLHRGRRLLPQIILVLPCVLVLASYCLGDIPGVNYVDSICVAGNYTSNSTFQDNLGLLLSSLNSTTPLTGFSNATIGLDSDKVYGLAMCRGDVTSNLCRNCLAAATASVGQHCPFRKAATVWYELCHLRYSNASFIGSPDTDYVKQFSTKIETDPEVFNRIRGNLLNVLTSRAESSPHMFAANQEKVSNSSSIYAMVQCTRDLDPKECNSCLTTMIEIIPTCCSDIKGAKLLAESCWLRYEDFSFFYNASALEDPLAPPPSSIQAPSPGGGSPTAIDAAGKSKDKGSLKIIVAITVPLVLTFVALILSAAVCICVRRSKTKTKILGSTAGEAIGKFESLLFNLETLRLATENFSESNKLGEGGFGAVYKGVLPNDQRIAVKRLSKGSAQGKGELRTEVDLVARLQHRNLVRLLGWCLEDQEMLLVYEYLPNKSLDRFLFDPGKSKLLNWERRVKIIEGVARGLLYLHEDSRLKVVHRDLKASNVLLDEDMDLKIADFGFARLLGDEQSLGNTRRPAGTLSAACPSYRYY